MGEDAPVRVRGHELAPDPDVFERTLSLAVVVRDLATDATPVGPVVVTAAGVDRPARRTPSGVYLFVDADLPDAPVTLRVDAGERYFRRETTVTAAELTATPPTATVTLVPTPAYDFPTNLTVVRGFLRSPPVGDAASETPAERAARGIGGATLSIGSARAESTVDQLDYTVETTPTGEFALPVPLGGPVETRVETFEEPVGPPDETGTPRERPAYRRWVTVDDADPVLTVRHEDVTPDDDDQPVATVSLELTPWRTTHVELELDEGAVERVMSD